MNRKSLDTAQSIFQKLRKGCSITIVASEQISESLTRKLAIRTRFVETPTSSGAACCYVASLHENGDCLEFKEFNANEYAQAVEYYVSICPPLTEEEINKYLEKGTECPFCGDDNISATEHPHITMRENEVHQGVQCYGCNRAWIDIYKLSGLKLK